MQVKFKNLKYLDIKTFEDLTSDFANGYKTKILLNDSSNLNLERINRKFNTILDQLYYPLKKNDLLEDFEIFKLMGCYKTNISDLKRKRTGGKNKKLNEQKLQTFKLKKGGWEPSHYVKLAKVMWLHGNDLHKIQQYFPRRSLSEVLIQINIMLREQNSSIYKKQIQTSLSGEKTLPYNNLNQIKKSFFEILKQETENRGKLQDKVCHVESKIRDSTVKENTKNDNNNNNNFENKINYSFSIVATELEKEKALKIPNASEVFLSNNSSSSCFIPLDRTDNTQKTKNPEISSTVNCSQVKKDRDMFTNNLLIDNNRIERDNNIGFTYSNYPQLKNSVQSISFDAIMSQLNMKLLFQKNSNLLFTQCLDEQLKLFQDVLKTFDRKSGSCQPIRENFLHSLSILESVAYMSNPMSLNSCSGVYNNNPYFNESNINSSICQNMMMYLANRRNLFNTNLN